MGCKESKHTVAAGNTIITPSPSKRHSINVGSSNNNNNDVQKIPENPTNAAKSPVQKQESLKANGDSNIARNPDEGTSWNNVMNIEEESKNAKGIDQSRVDEKKVKESEIVAEVFDDKEIKKENVGESNKKKEGVGVGEGVGEEKLGKGNLVCEESPNNLSSSRKDDDETIEGIISEGISGTSVYYTPHKEGASEDQSNKLESAEEMKESVEETKDDEEIIKKEAAGNVKKVEAAAGLDEGNEAVVSSTILAEAEKIEAAADVEVEVNSVKEEEVEIKMIRNEEKVVNAEKPVKEFTGSGNNPVLIIKLENNKVKEGDDDETIVVVESAAANKEEQEDMKISTANEENVTETSEEDSKTN